MILKQFPHFQNIAWRDWLRLFCFFAYFSVLPQSLLYFGGDTTFMGLRQAVFMSLLWLIPVMIVPQRAKPIAGMIGLILWAASLVSLGYFCIYGQEFSQSVIFVMFESNTAESAEYVSQYFRWWMMPVFLLHTIVAVWLWSRIKPLSIRPSRALAMGFAILFVLFLYPIFSQAVIRGKNADDVLEKMQSKIEPAVPWQLAMGYMQYQQQLSNMQVLLEDNAKIPPLKNLKDLHADQPATLVLVIGESTNRQHLRLYGYGRATSPMLDAMANELQVFNQVVAPRPYTIECLQQVLTFADQEHPDLYLTKPNLLNIMKQAGYKSFWITNQQTMTRRNTMLTTFSKMADSQVYLNNTRVQDSRQYDEDVLKPFVDALKDPAPRKFIVVHLLGTHMKYIYRYPPAYDHFKTRDGLSSTLTDQQVEVINSYDNAVLYNDFVVASLFKTYKDSKSTGAVVYFSDHGEDVYDSPGHHVLGRNESSPTLPMYAVPMLMWMTPEWKAHFNFKAEIFERPYSMSHFIHTWSDLAGITFDGFEPEKSLINPAFKPHPLLVGDPSSAKTLKVLPYAK